MGIACGAHGAEWEDFFHRSGAMTPGAAERLMAAYLTWRGIPPPRSLRSLVQRAQQPHVPLPQPGTYGNAAVKPVRTPVAILGSLWVCIYVPASRHGLISYSFIDLT